MNKSFLTPLIIILILIVGLKVQADEESLTVVTHPAASDTIRSTTSDGNNQISSYANIKADIGGGGGSSQWTTNGNDIYYSTGNVGIASINPDAALVVVGSIKSTSGSSALGFSGGGSILGNQAGIISIQGANLGIGTIAPSNSLQILSTTDPNAILLDAVGSVANSIIARRANGSVGSLTAGASGDNIFSISPSIRGSSAYATPSANFLIQGDAAATNTSTPTRVILRTIPSGSITASERLRIDSTGNVGINSTAPGQTVDVTGVVRATTFSGSAASLTSIPAAQISGVIPIANLATGTPDGTKFVRDDGTLVTPSTGSLSGMTTNKVQKATSSTTIGDSQITDNGTNVGIGTANPQAFFTIGSAGAFQTTGSTTTITATNTTTSPFTITANSLSSGTGFTLSSSSSSASSSLASMSLTSASATGTPLTVSNSGTGYSFKVNDVGADATPFIVDSAGNVGIGTLTASSPLTIFGAGTSAMQKLTGANTACTTTCGNYTCFFGEDTGVIGTLLDCSDATADVCLCSK